MRRRNDGRRHQPAIATPIWWTAPSPEPTPVLLGGSEPMPALLCGVDTATLPPRGHPRSDGSGAVGVSTVAPDGHGAAGAATADPLPAAPPEHRGRLVPARTTADGRGRHHRTEPPPPPHEVPIDEAEAASLAWAFGLDITCWDEDDPQRRAAVLSRYLPDVVTETLGWDGYGRQRSEAALPGRCHRIDELHVVVDVRVRVVPYRRLAGLGNLLYEPEDSPTPGAVAAAASAPAALGWQSCDAEWVRLAVPVARSAAGALVIDLTGQG